MSTIPTSEAIQAHVTWRNLSKHHDINPFLPLHHASCGLQEGQLYNPPLRDKTADAVNLSLVPHPLKDKLQFDSEFARCGHTSIGYETYKNPCMVAQGDDITHPDIGLKKGTIASQTDMFSSAGQWTGLGENAFEGSLHRPEVGSKYSDSLIKPVKYVQEQQIGDFLIMNNYTGIQLSAEADGDREGQRNETVDSTHGSTAAPIQVNAAIDKKEMRARRNRESARRSRTKSKQHFQRMEQTFVLMSRENRALLALMEKLLPNYIARFPHLRGKLQSLFKVR